MMSGNAPLLPDLPGNWPMRYRRSTTLGATRHSSLAFQPSRVRIAYLFRDGSVRYAVRTLRSHRLAQQFGFDQFEPLLQPLLGQVRLVVLIERQANELAIA